MKFEQGYFSAYGILFHPIIDEQLFFNTGSLDPLWLCFDL